MPFHNALLFLSLLMALALALPVQLDYWWTIQSIAFGVVIFALFFQSTSLPWVLRRHGLAAPGKP